MTEQLGGGLSDRDRQLLADVGDLRLVTGGQLQRLAFTGPGVSSHNARIARRCLHRLTTRGLLQRLQRRVGGIRGGSSSYVYALSPADAQVIDRAVSRGRSREPSLTFLTHQLAVAEVFVTLRQALQQGVLEALHVETEPRCWRVLDDGSGGVLKPDLYLVAATTTDELLAFIEVDNATEHAGALSRKADLYQAHYATGREQQAEGVFPEVLWLAADERRREQLAAVLARQPGPPGLHRVLGADEPIDYITKGGRDV